MSNVGKWTNWYKGKTQQIPYGNTITYDLAAEHLSGLAIEDWGCGYAWFKTLHDGPYTGVDGTETPWSDVVDDLATRRSESDGIMLRHVLEHNDEWQSILDNVIASAKKRLVIIVFTPNGNGESIGYTEALGIHDYAIPHSAVSNALKKAGWKFKKHTYKTDTQYGVEVIWLAENDNG